MGSGNGNLPALRGPGGHDRRHDAMVEDGLGLAEGASLINQKQIEAITEAAAHEAKLKRVHDQIMSFHIVPRIAIAVERRRRGRFIRCGRPQCGHYGRPRVRPSRKKCPSSLLCKKCGATYPYITRAQVKSIFESGAMAISFNSAMWASEGAGLSQPQALTQP